MHMPRTPRPAVRPARLALAAVLLAAAGAAAAQLAITPELPPVQMPPAAANPYGLAALWAQGDWVAKATLLVLVLMSVASWYVLISRLLAQARVARQAAQAERGFWGDRPIADAAAALQPGSPYRFVTETGLQALQRHAGLAGHVDLNAWLAQHIERAVGVVHARAQSGLAVLATVGSTAPFVGLFGTVWGIYNALIRIGASGQASIERVAGPVGEALIMTALGLAVAVPAVLGYNWLVRRNKVALDRLRDFGSELHGALLADAARPGGAA